MYLLRSAFWPHVQHSTSLPESPACKPNFNIISNLNRNPNLSNAKTNPKPNHTNPTNSTTLGRLANFFIIFCAPSLGSVARWCSG